MITNKFNSPVQHQFSQVPKVEIPRSVFNRVSTHKTTFDAGWLVPFYVDEALPGDTFNFSASLFARLSTPISPVMDNMNLDTFYFAVPIRLLWNNFQKFMGEVEPDDTTEYLVPQIDFGSTFSCSAGDIYDYMGIPPGVVDVRFSALFFRAYNRIWNEWFRDQNLQDSVKLNLGDGPDSRSDYTLLKRCKRHDYFTSCLPFPQKGDAIPLPLAGSADIVTSGEQVKMIGTGTSNTEGSLAWNNSLGVTATPGLCGDAGTVPIIYGSQTGLLADLSSVTASTINDLRTAFQMQRMQERDARGGTRYTEIVRSHFGVTSPDSRLQRSEYLGGNSTPVFVTPVMSTNGASTGSLGKLGAFGTARSVGEGFIKSFTEHCVILGLCSVRADLTYQQGLERKFSRRTKHDFAWPVLSHLGEQAVLNREIYCQGDSVLDGSDIVDEKVFGYQERYGEYRYSPSRISGIFRSTLSTPIDNWHLAQEFTSLPVLGNTFIQENPPIDRVIAVPSEPHFIFDSYMKCVSVRPLPLYGVPGMLDHF